MLKCENCIHKKVCINGVNFQNAESCRQYFNENDVVKVVRCKDCTYYDCIDNLCDLFDHEVPNDMFYCHDGFTRD